MNTGSRCSMHHTGSWSWSRRVARVGRVPLALLDRQAVLDLLLLGMVEADAEHVGVGELVHALVERAEDGVEVERRRDLAPHLAEQLDVLLAFALGARQRLGGFGAQLRFGELRPLAFLGDVTRSARQARDNAEDQHAEHDVAAVRPATCGTTAAGS